MKIFIQLTCLFVIVFLASCTFYSNYPQNNSGLSGLGIYPAAPPTEKEVEIYLPNEKPKDTAFVKLTLLEVAKNTSYNELIQAIKLKAKAEGVDAVLILDKKQGFAGDGSSYELLTGVGIRYKKNMDYLQKYVKWQKIYFQNSAASPLVPAVTIAYDYNSEVWKLLPEAVSNGDTVFTKYVQRWSAHHLLSEKKNWKFYIESSYQIDPSRPKTLSGATVRQNTYLKILSRAYYKNDIIDKKVDLQYNKTLVSAVKITYFNEFDKAHNKIVETVHFKWNPNGTVAETMISAKNGLQFKEYFFYDTEGKLQYSSMVRLAGNREIPFIKSMYEYFSLDDFADAK